MSHRNPIERMSKLSEYLKLNLTFYRFLKLSVCYKSVKLRGRHKITANGSGLNEVAA